MRTTRVVIVCLMLLLLVSCQTSRNGKASVEEELLSKGFENLKVVFQENKGEYTIVFFENDKGLNIAMFTNEDSSYNLLSSGGVLSLDMPDAKLSRGYLYDGGSSKSNEFQVLYGSADPAIHNIDIRYSLNGNNINQKVSTKDTSQKYKIWYLITKKSKSYINNVKMKGVSINGEVIYED
ncbi:hypothetical protein J31TS4_19840 [Paenibacillus sp. J31TS4]|uniref:hypothetical protein n=1 Tax=Paenibacillus sp. J31TS4 TaxID=2807195 RepID=UPI001B0834DA|nr:hypothetical protein [Paenibacillus sp. J31TS4]GIP38704.1 hypothetical protein J31TS4_19840 [Paenibacillus sp. J31TS4]